MLTLSLYRRNNVPTRAEVLLNKDYYLPGASSSLLSDNEPRVNTDALLGVAWISPSEYVVPVADEQHEEDFELRLFRDGCEVLGSVVVYAGTEIDFGYANYSWPILPAGEDGVLGLGAEDVQERLAAGDYGTAPWKLVSIPEGEITEPGAQFDPNGAWTWVSPASDYNPGEGARWDGEGCDDLEWVWP